MNFVTLFPETENIHLTKDVGMIAYILHKYYGYNSTIACYKNGEYDYLNNEVKGLKIDFIKRYTGKRRIDVIIYLIKNVRKTNILHLFHLSSRSLCCAFIYKLLNPKGQVYLKLDADYRIKEFDFNKRGIKGTIKRWLMKKCKLISIETKNLHKYTNNNWNLNVEYIPNGFYDYGIRNNVNYEEKENIICTVGRIGTNQKATEVLLEGFKIAADKIKDWKLKIIGPIEDEFRSYIDNFYKENPNLKERIIFTGPIYDRKKLENEYRKAKVFCLTSRYESFGLVFLEAMKNGCYIITSNVESSSDITDNKKYGDIFSVDDEVGLAQCFSKTCNQENKIKENCSSIQSYAYERFYWPTICKKIDSLLKK
ncbi:glycosyltransferase [Clostridium estertheticum]|uniref:glycosyltransferase n=1 Tax=Clostridium estertheticum TaxID=238834 RepID=UPI001C0BADD6|nr:glycosyltransferase [Clostridium estertheticum]MBU3073206.1 glycosyltransferase [Clostridium estertheticum]MBU3163553.1 glycosyltransferase [Clostridium estertheticum]